MDEAKSVKNQITPPKYKTRDNFRCYLTQECVKKYVMMLKGVPTKSCCISLSFVLECWADLQIVSLLTNSMVLFWSISTTTTTLDLSCYKKYYCKYNCVCFIFRLVLNFSNMKGWKLELRRYILVGMEVYRHYFVWEWKFADIPFYGDRILPTLIS